MNPILARLKEWNDVFKEHHGLLSIRLYDDGSGYIIGFNQKEIFEFNPLSQFFDTDPQKVKNGKK